MEQDKKSQIWGIVVTLLFHVLLVVLLWLAHFSPFAHEEESGILVMTGIDAEGSGEELMSSDVTDLEPEPQPEEVPPTPPAPAPQPTPSPQPTTEPLLAQDDAEAPYVAEQKAEELKKQKEEEARLLAEAEARRQEELRRQQEEEARRRAAEEAARKKAAEEAAKRQAISNQMAGLFNNKGTGNNAGTQGDAHGNSMTGATSGSAGYGEFDLGGRGMVGALPRPAFNLNVSGKVVVLITVDAAGNVKSTAIGKGTTISSQEIRNAAKEAAMKAKFKSVSGTSITAGTITYYFDSNN
ncbi:MAG: energy transducer TonB [Bacteroidales bacterium]|nr:energy transducer TonB [Bacteroidales bacterium]